jgi:hypothetical protein
MSIDLPLINTIQFGSHEEPATDSFRSLDELNCLGNASEKEPLDLKTLSIFLNKIKPCYSGSKYKIDPSSMRPENFIGPLENVLLLDSLDRRIMQVATGVLSDNIGVMNFIVKIPGITTIEAFNPSKPFISPKIPFSGDCLDEAFKDEDFYKKSLTNLTTYNAMRDSALEVRNPISFLACMGYRQAQNPSLGDIVVYFTNTRKEKELQQQEIKEIYTEIPYVGHYGRVCEIREDGQILVRSKFSRDAGVYQHRIELVFHHYGNSYLIYSKK